MSEQSVDLGFVELDPTGFEMVARSKFSGRYLLRHSCGHTSFLDGLSLSEMSSAAFLHRMDGCKAGTALQCGLCRKDFEEGEAYRHDGSVWVHRDGCPQYQGGYIVPSPSPDTESVELARNGNFPETGKLPNSASS